jgi:putative sigma-54 modulation protein
MRFEYSGRHIEVTQALRAHVEGHFQRIEHIFGNKPIRAHVIIEVERGRHRSEIVVYWRNDVLTATTSNSDMYRSLSQSIDKIEKQALRLKNKVIDKSHKAVRTSEVAQPASEIQPTPRAPRIIKSRQYAIKPLIPEDAALLLNGETNAFLVFRNAENHGISVIYKREDGNFGLIEPK